MTHDDSCRCNICRHIRARELGAGIGIIIVMLMALAHCVKGG